MGMDTNKDAKGDGKTTVSEQVATFKDELAAELVDPSQDDFAGQSARDPIMSTLEGLGALFDGVKGVSGAALTYAAGKTLDQANRVLNSTPEQLERMGIAGRSLKDLRQVTGVTLDELAGAIDLKNPDILKAIEDGSAALPFEILLRLASFYARNNPLPFILKYARTYNPRISNMLEKIGIDKLVIEAEREMQIVQIYRKRDAARQLSDEGFERVRLFTDKAFDMALHFAASGEDILMDDEIADEPVGNDDSRAAKAKANYRGGASGPTSKGEDQ